MQLFRTTTLGVGIAACLSALASAAAVSPASGSGSSPALALAARAVDASAMGAVAPARVPANFDVPIYYDHVHARLQHAVAQGLCRAQVEAERVVPATETPLYESYDACMNALLGAPEEYKNVNATTTTRTLRSYVASIATVNPFPPSFIAAPASYPDWPSIRGATEQSRRELVEIFDSLRDTSKHHAFAFRMLIVYLALYFVMIGIYKFLEWASPTKFGSLTWDQKQAVGMNVFRGVCTTASFFLQITALPSLWQEYNSDQFHNIILAGFITAECYLFEISHRWTTPGPQIKHHLISTTCTCYLVYMIKATRDPSYIATATIWLFQATTDQGVFACLVLSRLGVGSSKMQAQLLRFSSIVAFSSRIVCIAILFIIWLFWQRQNTSLLGLTFSVFLILALAALLKVQYWGFRVKMKLADNIKHKAFARRDARRLAEQQARLAQRQRQLDAEREALLARESEKAEKGAASGAGAEGEKNGNAEDQWYEASEPSDEDYELVEEQMG